MSETYGNEQSKEHRKKANCNCLIHFKQDSGKTVLAKALKPSEYDEIFLNGMKVCLKIKNL